MDYRLRAQQLLADARIYPISADHAQAAELIEGVFHHLACDPETIDHVARLIQTADQQILRALLDSDTLPFETVSW